MLSERGLILIVPLEGAAAPLAEHLHREGVAIPEIVGTPSDCRAFVNTWEALTGQRAVLELPQFLYRLDNVIPVHGVAGRLRRGSTAEAALLVEWANLFYTEAFGANTHAHAEDYVSELLDAAEPRGIWVWEVDGKPVSTASVNRITPHGAVISLVYTPPAERRKGCAAALTAALSAHLLTSGRQWCALYTDQTNATSNHIYQSIGYIRIGEQDDWVF
jgi:ribosomal protein S18 acetylase RimI-like enzyme